MNTISKHKMAQRRKFALTDAQLRTIAFVATLILAGIAISLKIDTPVVWTFLGVAIGRTGIKGI